MLKGQQNFDFGEKRLVLLTDGPRSILGVTHRENEGTFSLSRSFFFNIDSLPL
jgi:hypothetical protein